MLQNRCDVAHLPLDLLLRSSGTRLARIVGIDVRIRVVVLDGMRRKHSFNLREEVVEKARWHGFQEICYCMLLWLLDALPGRPINDGQTIRQRRGNTPRPRGASALGRLLGLWLWLWLWLRLRLRLWLRLRLRLRLRVQRYLTADHRCRRAHPKGGDRHRCRRSHPSSALPPLEQPPVLPPLVLLAQAQSVAQQRGVASGSGTTLDPLTARRPPRRGDCRFGVSPSSRSPAASMAVWLSAVSGESDWDSRVGLQPVA
eukprot:COSAG02_NODE_7473_length_2996_cov_5.791508_3_plen_257_part_00